MSNSFSIWIAVALAHLSVSFPHDSHEGGGVTPEVNQFDSLKPITQEALRKYMADPEDTRRRLAAMVPDIPQDQATLDRIHQELGGLTVDSSVRSTNPSVVNAKAGVSPYFRQGDVVVTDDQLKQMEDEYKRSGGRKKRQAAIPMRKWPQNTINYYFHNVTDKTKQAVAAGLKMIQQQTCINFVESSTAANRIRIIDADGCWSLVGMKGGEQDLSLQSDGCDLQGTAAHEFMHAIGYQHEQSRYDRDEYITVDLTNVEPDSAYNFDKETDETTVNYISYDYGSVMQYGADSFSTNGQISMVSKNAEYQRTMGSSIVAYSDIRNINMYYSCKPTCTAAQNQIKCLNSGTKNPRDCSTCICPVGYAGATCNERPNNGGETITPTANLQTLDITVGDPASSTSTWRPSYMIKTYWFTVPAGQKLEMQITAMQNNQCQYGCPFASLEFKYGSYPQLVDPKYCCPEHLNKPYSSTRNPTVLNAHNEFYQSTFTIQYRLVANG
ncbi:hypothetical protein WR25_01495 [Diploscapter pachys]|uniref:Metalloendopeptidase n=1 Tax=Diploscapter pachys TaxID=2018661 RepID=A0A2A2JR28_9BILA|nr:hypothetical protein WR25_01495 [Diploscapter pachys]